MIRLEELFPAELDARLAETPALLLPVGTIEWHGHHLPLGLDVLKANALAEAASERCGAVVAPPTWLAAGGVPFPHTLTLPGTLIEPLLTEVVVHFATEGFRVVCLVNGHYGLENTLATKRAAAQAMHRTGATVLAVADYELLIDEGARGDHAGEWETALMLAVRPELVRLDDAGDRPGVIGADPAGATPEQGRRGLEAAARRLAAAVERALDEDRAAYAEALTAGVEALEALWELRQRVARDQAPPVQTQAWLDYCQALHGGRYTEAKDAAGRKLREMVV
jgi:creatinine amidohydrolase